MLNILIIVKEQNNYRAKIRKKYMVFMQIFFRIWHG